MIQRARKKFLTQFSSCLIAETAHVVKSLLIDAKSGACKDELGAKPCPRLIFAGK